MDILISGCRILPVITNLHIFRVISGYKHYDVFFRLIPGMYWIENLRPENLIYVKNLLTLQSESVP